ncbi:MAG: hypothetical protein ABIF19_06155 [Planctomycetota bacterium]
MKQSNTSVQKYEAFEKLLLSGLTIFAAVAILTLAGSGNLIGPLLLALCCLSVALPFLVFQIACLTLGINQRHKFLLQTSTVVVALVGVFGLLISVSSFIGVVFAVSCLCAYYLFVTFSGESETTQNATQPNKNSNSNHTRILTENS